MKKSQVALIVTPSQVWERPVLVPLPSSPKDVNPPVILLNGIWKLNTHPPREYWSNVIDPASWSDAEVPGYTETQGFVIEEDQEYAYKYKFQIPSDFTGRKLLLRFDGVTGYARVWVNGAYVRNHYGGFTSWDCDISNYVSLGHEIWLTVGVTFKPKELSPFNLGGIIRDVKLVALAPDHVTRLHVRTDLDSDYRNASLRVIVAMTFDQHEHAQVSLALKDPQGYGVEINPNFLVLNKEKTETSIEIPVNQPQKWDAEHPNLYTLEASVMVDGQVVETLSKKVGFRNIEVKGNKLYVSGNEVKLRGVNRHDIHPQTGRAITPNLVEQDVKLFVSANINFVRTSHYPPREDFLDACDKYGIFIEEEISVAFIEKGFQNDPDFTSEYMNQFTEMIERDQSHPCVLMWSLANESSWGRNFQKEYDYAKVEDPTRPVIFSYPNTMLEGTQAFDIWSLHYASWDCNPSDMAENPYGGKTWGHRAPVLHDEYVHVPCYDLIEQSRDPSVREFWGESIKRFWENIFATEGALGGAIWAGIDEVMITPEGSVGWQRKGFTALQWGIIDGWRREKPEYWLTKKAYSPIRIPDQPVHNPGSSHTLMIPIKNWFNHTNLKEIAVHWAVDEDHGIVTGPDLEPHSNGNLVIEPRDWQDGEVLNLKFYRMQDILVDEYNLPIGAQQKRVSVAYGSGPITIYENKRSIIISGDAFEVIFSKETGLIDVGTYKGSEVIKGGPYLHLVGVELLPWSFKDIRTKTEGYEAVIDIFGAYGPVEVHFKIIIDGHGLLTTTYKLEKLPITPPRVRKLGYGLDIGGYREVGVSFILPNGVDRLTWERKGLWSAYPEDHIGRNAGTAYRVRKEGEEKYGEYPSWSWAEDMRDYTLFGRYDVGGRGTIDFRSMKHGIWHASALIGGTQSGVRAESDGTDSVRLEVLDNHNAKIDDRDPTVHYVGTWIPMDGEVKSYHSTETYSNKAGDYVELIFRGTGICWFGSKDTIMGEANVYIDGNLEASDIDLSVNALWAGISHGEEKAYQQILFSKEGLTVGEHKIKIVVTGKKNPRSNNAFVSIDSFLVLGARNLGDVRFIINNEWNYPELTWGNYVKDPVLITEGYSNKVKLRLTDLDGE